MRISAKTIERLTEIITGDTEKSPYRSGPQLIEFFRDFGERDLYGQGFPARAYYVQEKLRKFNGTETMERIVSAAFDFFGEDEFNPEEQAKAAASILSANTVFIVHPPSFLGHSLPDFSFRLA